MANPYNRIWCGLAKKFVKWTILLVYTLFFHIYIYICNVYTKIKYVLRCETCKRWETLEGKCCLEVAGLVRPHNLEATGWLKRRKCSHATERGEHLWTGKRIRLWLTDLPIDWLDWAERQTHSLVLGIRFGKFFFCYVFRGAGARSVRLRKHTLGVTSIKKSMTNEYTTTVRAKLSTMNPPLESEHWYRTRHWTQRVNEQRQQTVRYPQEGEKGLANGRIFRVHICTGQINGFDQQWTQNRSQYYMQIYNVFYMCISIISIYTSRDSTVP